MPTYEVWEENDKPDAPDLFEGRNPRRAAERFCEENMSMLDLSTDTFEVVCRDIETEKEVTCTVEVRVEFEAYENRGPFDGEEDE